MQNQPKLQIRNRYINLAVYPYKKKNPASYPEAGYLLLNKHHALPFWLKVEANIKTFR
jgi:hypothetical protein